MRGLMLAAFMAAVLPSSLIRAQEQPPTAPPPAIISAFLKFCKVGHPEECRLERISDEQGVFGNTMECMRALAMTKAEFTYEGERWETRGGFCKEGPSDYAAWRQAQKAKP